MFFEKVENKKLSLNAFIPCPTASERAKWSQIPDRLTQKYIKRGEKLLNYSWQFLTAKDWLLFTKTGNRSDYENVYFAKRRALNDLVMAEACEYKGRFLPDIINGLYAITAETAWWIPAHNSYIRDTQQLPLPNTQRPIVELFSAETAALLAMVGFVLKKEIENVSPFILPHIKEKLCKRIFTPYLNEHFWWMGSGDEEMCNWTPWCTQNILIAAFLSDLPNQDRYNIVKKAAYSLDCFVNSYGEDGCCNEGAQYYHHAALTLFGAIEVLCAADKGVFGDLYQNPKIKNMATYILNVHVGDKYYINFADCSPIAGRRGAREYLFAKRTDNKAMQAFAASDFDIALQESDQNGDIARINLYYSVLEAFGANEMINYTEKPQRCADIYYKSAGVFIARDDVFCLSVKAGNNGDGHNHNDTGSIILYKNEKPFLIDLGVESYTKKTFSPERYDIWTMQSAWHNLPTFNDVMQSAGKQFAATEVELCFQKEKSSIAMNIAQAYPSSAGVNQYNRTCVLQKGDGVYLTDKTDYSGEVVLSLLTKAQPQINNQAVKIGDIGIITVLTPCSINAEKVNITDERLSSAWQDTVYRVQIKFSTEIAIKLE